MKNTKALCQTAVVAALYVALTTLNPLSWGAVQFRVANMLCALPFGGACTQAAMDRLAAAVGNCNRKRNESFRPGRCALWSVG